MGVSLITGGEERQPGGQRRWGNGAEKGLPGARREGRADAPENRKGGFRGASMQGKVRKAG